LLERVAVMAPQILFEVPDGRGKPVRVFEHTWRQHVLVRHPEFEDGEEAVRLTISDPDIVVRPPKRPRGIGVDRRVNCRLGAHSRYNELYVVVPIDYAREESWLVTAMLSARTPKGDLVFVRVPIRWS
jgi:hypothetical protein